ncbi:MAG: hypothetical protein Q9184_001109 [Pyrenodesmia sp. 2 TL-2023]
MDDKSSASRAAEKRDKLDAQVKSVDMTEEMQQQAIEVGMQSPTSDPTGRREYTLIKGQHLMQWRSTRSRRYELIMELVDGEGLTEGLQDIAQCIKKEFDSRAGATWHCIVGRNFGSFVTHGQHPKSTQRMRLD